MTAVEYVEPRSLVGLLCTCAANPDRLLPRALTHMSCVFDALPDLRVAYPARED